MSYVKKTIQPYFTSKQFNTSNNNNQVTKDKLVQLWCEDKKKAISIINNNGYWPETVHPEIDKKKTEEYYENKYNHFRSNLKQIVEDFPDRDEIIPDFTPNETGNVIKVIKASPPGKKWGYDGVRFEDFKKNVSNTSVEVSNILNVIKYCKKSPRTWKGAFVRRTPKKNYNPNDLTTLRDISLLPTIYKIFAKCLVNRILPKLIGSAVQFWKKAYIKDRDRQELIFFMKTAIDDFRHTSSRFYAIFVDFRDAFGSLDQEYLIWSLLDSGIEKTYCLLIADISTKIRIFRLFAAKNYLENFRLQSGQKRETPSVQSYLLSLYIDRLKMSIIQQLLVQIFATNSVFHRYHSRDTLMI